MDKRIFKLKQHTPLLHFQHNQEGATLRATEVKPRLDSFILEYCKKEKIDFKKWQIDPKRSEAFDYKMSIETSGKLEYYLPMATKTNSRKSPNLIEYIMSKKAIDVTLLEPSPVFSNSDKIKFAGDQVNEMTSDFDNIDIGIKEIGNVTIKIVSRYNDLLPLLDKIFGLFLLSTNFGKRQSKGFGSFSLVFNKDTPQPNPKVLNGLGGINGIYVIDVDTENLLLLFENIDTFWKVLKSGKNYGGYEKSDLFQYFYKKTPAIRWEKRAIKKKLSGSYNDVFRELDKKTHINRILSSEDIEDNHFYIRALLGLAENNEYGTNNNRDKIQIDIVDKHSACESTKHMSIDRFKSPITIKPVEGKVYLLVHEIPKLLTTDKNGNPREFKFSLKSKIGGLEKVGVLDNLKVPAFFDVCDFLDSPKINTETGNEVKKGNKTMTVAEYHHFSKLT